MRELGILLAGGLAIFFDRGQRDGVELRTRIEGHEVLDPSERLFDFGDFFLLASVRNDHDFRARVVDDVRDLHGHQRRVERYVDRARAFGWHTIQVDGHDVEAIDSAYAEAAGTVGVPTAIVARTIKGKGVATVENKEGFHGKTLDDADAAIQELGGPRDITVQTALPASDDRPHSFTTDESGPPAYTLGDKVATRKAYGDALAALGSRRGDVVALDAEVSNSTFAVRQYSERRFMISCPDRTILAS